MEPTEEIFLLTHQQKMHLIRTQGSTKFFHDKGHENVPNYIILAALFTLSLFFKEKKK